MVNIGDNFAPDANLTARQVVGLSEGVAKGKRNYFFPSFLSGCRGVLLRVAAALRRPPPHPQNQKWRASTPRLQQVHSSVRSPFSLSCRVRLRFLFAARVGRPLSCPLPPRPHPHHHHTQDKKEAEERRAAATQRAALLYLAERRRGNDKASVRDVCDLVACEFPPSPWPRHGLAQIPDSRCEFSSASSRLAAAAGGDGEPPAPRPAETSVRRLLPLYMTAAEKEQKQAAELHCDRRAQATMLAAKR